MDISYIIPAFNCEKSISRTVQSIICQNCSDYEIIIVNDGSTDGTEAVIDTLIDENPLVIFKYLRQNNAGPGVARNTGIKHAKGEYLVFVDADDVLPLYSTRTLLDSIMENDQVDFCYGAYAKIINENNSKTIMKSEVSGMATSEETLETFLSGKCYISLWNSIFLRRIVIENELLFPSTYFGEDIFFISKYLMCCQTVKYVDAVVYEFRYNSDRSLKRESKLIYNLDNNVWYSIAKEFKGISKWKSSYESLIYGRLPVVMLLEISKHAYYAENYLRFFEFLNLPVCKDMLFHISEIKAEKVKYKTFIKTKIGYHLVNSFPRVFYFVNKCIYSKQY